MTARRKIASFVALVFAMSLPFWALGARMDAFVLPGLPVSALMVCTPALAAVLLTALGEERGAALRFAVRVFDAKRAPVWALVIAIAIMPALTVCAWVWMRADGVPMPAPEVSLGSALVLFAMFWASGAMEELGWSGYLAGPAIQLWGFLGAAIAIGLIWAIWHFVPLLQAGRGWEWIAWWTLATVAARIVTLTLFKWSNESVFAVSALHGAQNTAWQVFPMSGSHYDPAYAAPMFLAAAAMCVALVSAGAYRQ